MDNWGNEDEGSNLEYRQRGLSNQYNMNKLLKSGPEYITIYDSQGSLKSKIISIALIISVIAFCGLFFTYLFRDNTQDQTAQKINIVSAQSE